MSSGRARDPPFQRRRAYTCLGGTPTSSKEASIYAGYAAGARGGALCLTSPLASSLVNRDASVPVSEHSEDQHASASSKQGAVPLQSDRTCGTMTTQYDHQCAQGNACRAKADEPARLCSSAWAALWPSLSPCASATDSSCGRPQRASTVRAPPDGCASRPASWMAGRKLAGPAGWGAGRQGPASLAGRRSGRLAGDGEGTAVRVRMVDKRLLPRLSGMPQTICTTRNPIPCQPRLQSRNHLDEIG